MAERISKSNFEEKIASGKALIVFYSDSCVPCKRQNPVLSSLEEKYGEKISIFKVNSNFDSELAEKYSVMAAPTLILFENGKEKDRKTGFQPLEALEEWINN